MLLCVLQPPPERVQGWEPEMPAEGEPRASTTMLVVWLLWLVAVWATLIYAALVVARWL